MENEQVSVQPTSKSIPELPTGKQHHVFISYAEVDQKFAYDLIEKLENVGYKVCHHNKDFTPGWPITDNIKHFVMGSMKTVVILSNGAIASPYCSYETQITLYMSLEMRKNILIPLAIENCTIPDHLKTLTRVECFNEKVDWWTKLLDAINAADMVPIVQSDLPAISSQAFGYNPHYSNMDFLVNVECDRDLRFFGEGLNKRYVPEALSKRGIQVTQKEYEEVKDKIDSYALLKYSCFCWKDGTLCFVISIFITFFLTGMILMILKLEGKCAQQTKSFEDSSCLTNYHIGIGVVSILLAVILTCCLPCCYIQNKKRNHLYKVAFPEINKHLMKHQVMVSSSISSFFYPLVLYFVYYNYQPCLDHLRTVLETKNKQTRPNNALSTLNTESGCEVTKMTLRYENECHRNECSMEVDPEENSTESKATDESASADSISVQLEDEMKENNADNKYEEEAKSMLLKHSGMYLKSFKDEILPTLKSPRHTRNVICLCEYVEGKERLLNSSNKKKSRFPYCCK